MADIKNLNIGNSENIAFVYSEETGLPSWAALIKEDQLNKISRSLYDFAIKNFLIIMNSNMSNKDDFSFAINRNTFTNCQLNSELGILKEYLFGLYNETFMKFKKYNTQIYVSLFSDISNNFIHAIMDANNIIFGAKLDNKMVM